MSRSLLPHGCYGLLVVFLAFSGWFASLWEGDGCNYAIVKGPIVDQLDPSYTNYNPITTLQFGFDSYREIIVPLTTSQAVLPPTTQKEVEIPGGTTGTGSADKPVTTDQQQQQQVNTTVSDILLPNWSKNRTLGCIDYPIEVTLGIMDSSWNTARTFAFLGLVLGGAGSSFLFCSICFVFSKATWRWTGYDLLLASLCQIISLGTWFNTQLCTWNTCNLGRGSKSDIAAVILWTIAGVMVVSYYPDTTTCTSTSTTAAAVHDHSSDDGSNNGDGNKRNKNRNEKKKQQRESQEKGLVDVITGTAAEDDVDVESQLQLQLSGQSSGEEIVHHRQHNRGGRRHRKHHLHQKLSSDDDDEDNNNDDDGRRYPQAEIS